MSRREAGGGKRFDMRRIACYNAGTDGHNSDAEGACAAPGREGMMQ